MRVVHAAKFYPPVEGGMETVVGDLCAGTARDWDVRVVAANTGPWTERDTRAGVRILRSGSLGQIASVPLCPSFPFHVWNTHADCVVLHEPNPVAGTTLFLHRPAPHLVVWHHSDLLRPWWAPPTYGRLQRALYRRADCVIVSSPPLAAGSSLVGAARRVAVIPFGIDLARYQRGDAARRAQVAAIRDRVPGPRILFVGRLVYYKGVDLLIDALARCRGSLIIVGEGPLDGPLRSQAMRRGFGDRVTFAGRVSDDDLPAYYQAADAFVLPSIAKTEAFGVVQAEAMAAGLPVVRTESADRRALGEPARRERTGRAAWRCARPWPRAGAARRGHGASAASRRRRQAASRDAVLPIAHGAGLQDPDRNDRRPAGRARFPRRAHARGGGMSHVAKRALDVLLSGAGLAASAPLWFLIAVAIRLDSRGPVFFRQARVGRRGRHFDVLKFRSMVDDADRHVGPRPAEAGDARITRVGRWLRATAADELPQLWNIFRGDMSFVGPRALRPEEIDTDTAGRAVPLERVPGFAERCSVTPGLTGIAQIYARRDVSRRQKFRFDRLYIRRRSFWLDLRLILLSFWITFRGTWEARERKF